jgi:hypothetical protein
MERELLGILGVAIVSASVLVMLTAGERDPILVTGIRYPESMKRSNEDYPFTISLIATRDVEEVEIRVRTVPGFRPEDDLDAVDRGELAESFTPLKQLISFSSLLGMSISPREMEVESGEEELDLLYFDFCPVFERIIDGDYGEDCALFCDATSCYGFLYQGGDLNISFKGGAEIYPHEPSTVSEIVIEVDGKVEERWRRGEEPLYTMGRIPVSDISDGTRIDVIYYVDGRKIGGGPLLWLLDIKSSGESIHSAAYTINV